MAMAANLSEHGGRSWAVATLVFIATSAVQAAGEVETLKSDSSAQTSQESQAPSEQTQKRGGWVFTPSIGVTETYTDNVALASGGRERSDWVTEIKPKIQIRGIGARLKLSLDYELQKYFYARNSSFDRTQNSLNGTATVEAIEKFFYVDARAVIAQLSSAPLGPQTVSNANFTSNRTETRFFALSPYVKGSLGDVASYEIRHNASRTSNGSSTTISDSRSNEWVARARNRVPLASFGWALDYSNRTVSFGTNESEFESAKATLLYQLDPQVRLSINAGREKNDFVVGSQSYSNHGFGFEWRPTPRTLVSGQQDQRFFGKGYNYRFSHRTPLSSWSLGYFKDIGTTSDQLQNDVPTDAYNAVFNSAFFIASFPDPAAREIAVRQWLALNNIPASTNQTLLANRVFLSRRIDASFALIGARNTLTFNASRSENSSVSGGFGTDVFSGSTGIRQRTISGAWSHKISEISTLNFLASQTRSEGSAPVTQSSSQRLLNVSLTHKLGPKTLGSLGLRKVRFDAQGGTLNGYDEKALTGSLSVTF